MKIEEAEPSSSGANGAGSEMPPASAELLRNIIETKTDEQFIEAINKGREVHAVMGKTELYKWTEVLNRCDEILGKAVVKNEQGNMLVDCDKDLSNQVVSVIRFTVLLFECTSSRRIYKSVDRILSLLESTDMDTLAEVLRLLQVMGKRSKFLSTRIPQKEQHALAHRLTAIAQCWSGKLRTVKMAECLKREPKLPSLFPFTYTDDKQRTITVEQPKIQEGESVGELITRTGAQLSPLTSSDSVPNAQFSREDGYCLLSRLRMLVRFDVWKHRFKCLVVRLLSVSTLVYCRLSGTDENTINSLLYSGFIEEIVDLLKAEREPDSENEHSLYDAIQTEALSTLCSIATYEKEPKITQILEALSAGSYHGFLSVMTRQIVDELKSNNLGKPGKPSVFLATSLFSFIYHLASIEPGGDTLVGSGLTQTLLSVIGFHELPIDCITFGTRCARIIDLFTTIDVTAFKANNGMEICVNRVVHEVNECRKEQPFVIDTSYDPPFVDEPEPEPRAEQGRRDGEEDGNDGDDEEDEGNERGVLNFADPVDNVDLVEEFEILQRNFGAALAQGMIHDHVGYPMPAPFFAGVRPRQVHDEPTDPRLERPAVAATESLSSTSTAISNSDNNKIKGGPWEQVQHNGTSCHQQRSGLIKGLLTFIKRAIGDVQLQDVMRHLMGGDLPEALMHILSNAEYYSPSLFHQSAHLITNFVYQFPDELSSLQRRHVPYVIFQSLLRKELPNSKDVITTLGSVFTAMCFNERGLRQFKSYDPFDQIFRIVLSVKFLVTLRKKRSSEAFESAQAIGGALDDLMRHSPDLKHDMLKSIIIILDLLDEIGRTPPAGVELVPTLTKTMARSVVLSSNSSLLPREAHEAREETPRASGGGAPEQADERVGGDTGEEEEEPMEVEDGEDSDVDEDDNEMSMDEMSGEAPIVNTVSPAAPSPKPVAPKPFEYGPGMMCEDGNGKKILPIGDYMLLIARVVETMMTQSPSQRFTDEFIQSGGMQKIMKLCHLPCITNESTHSTYITTIANIVKHIVKAGFTGQRNGQESGPKLMAAIIGEFIKTIEPFFEVNNGDFSAMKAADSKKATILMHLDEKLVEKTLVELNSLVPILLNLNKNAPQSYTPQDQRNRLFETWKMPDGVKLYGMLRKLSRMLSWEHELIQTLKPTIRTAATQTDGDALSDQLGGDSHLDAEVLPPWDEKEEKVKENEKEECKDARWKAAGVSQEEHDFWLKNKSLQDIVSKSHHLVKELLNSMGKQINLPTMRRPRPRDPAQLPMAATACISMIFNSIYKDLKWEPPGAANSSMAYGRYIELLTQLNFSLFENNTNARCTNPALAQFFYTSGCHKAFFELFTDKIIPFLGDDMPAGVEQTMEEWCRLAVKLTDRNSIVSGDQLMHRRDRSLPEFDTNKYLKLVCRDMFNVYKQFFEKMAQMPDFELKSLKKVCENAFAVFKEVAKNLVEETELAAAAAAASAASAAASAVPAASSAADAPPEDWAPGVPFRQVASNSEAPPAAPPPPPAVAAHPQEDQIVMMMDLGFSREIVTYAVENTRSVDEAANYLLAHGHEIRAQEVINAFRDEAPIHLALVQQAIGGSAAPAAGSTSAAIPNVEEIERRLNEHLSEVSHDDVLSGDELVRSAQRVLDTMGLVSISEQLSDACPNDGSEMSSERVVNAALDLVRNSRTPLFEENIATPLIPPLSQLKIDQDVSLNSACKQLFPLVNRLLLVSNDTIHPCAELIISIFPAMTEEWRKEHLIATIIGQDLIKMLGNLVEQEVDDNEVPRKHEVARTMANRLHFAVLIFDKVGEEYVEWINSTTIVDNMLKSLDYLVRRINNVEYYQSLITRIVCWFDFYAKIQRFISRRKFLKSLAPTLEWHFQQVEEDTLRRRAEFPNGERKWVAFDQQSQKILNDAFFSGVRWAKLSLKRPGRTPRKTEVDFITMKHFDGNTSTSRENVKADLPANVDINIKDLMTSEASLSFTNVNNDRLLRLATDVIRSGNLDPKCSHSMLSFIARLTRAPHNANQFLENGGVEALLQLRARCSPTYPFLVSMILRHCIDDDSMSSVIYEKTLRAYIASSSPQSSSSVADYSPSKPKDFVETLQLFSAMSSWNPLVFTEVINKIARTQDNDIVLMTKEKEKKATSGPTTSSTCTSSSHPTIVENNYRSLKVIHLMIIEIFEGHFPTSGSGQSRMLSKEKILSILSEIIKSYPSLAVVISEMRHGEQAEMTVMHKLIDTYVSPSPENVETANALKTLIAVISAAQNAGKAQESLVMDIKNALAIYSDKALDMRGEGVILQQENELRPEEREAAMNAFKTDEKEVLQKIQDLCAIIVTMCQSCPPQHHHHHHHHHHTTSDRNRSNHQNSVMKLFHKKKICADLVKTIHSLQLGTKESLDTVNQILKTLDTLLEGAGQNQNSLPALPRSFIEMVAGRRAGTRDREVAGGVGVHERQDLDNLIGHDAGFAFDGEMRQLLRRLNDETFRGVGVGAGAARARVAQQAGDDNDGEEEEEEEEEGSETSETSQNDAVQGNEEGVEVVVAEAIPVPIQEDEHEEDENLRVDIIGEEEDGEEEDNEDDDDDDDADDDGDGEDDEEDSEGDQGEQPGGGVGPHIIDLDDIDEDADDEEDERLEQEIMNDDEGAVRILQAANGEPSRRLLVDDDEDDDDDGDEDSMEDDGARLDLDDDYFGIGGHFGDIHRVDDMLFQHSFGRGPISAIADIFRDEIDYLPSYRPERRLTAPRSTFGVVSEHPLLTRPPSDSDVPRRLPPTSYRAEILMHGPGGRTALHRQNAIRRTTTETRELEAISRGIRMSELQPGRMVVRGGEVLHPTSFFDHIFDIRPTNVSFSQRMAAYRNYNSAFQDSREERRDARATQVPNILERLDSYMNSMDPVSVRFVTVIVNSLLTKFHKAREAQIKKEAEAKAKAKKEAESAKKAAEEKKLGAHIRRHAQAAAAASPATLAETPAPTPAEMGLATPATTNTTITVSDTVAPTPASASSGAEPMETGDEVPQSSAATAASSVAGVEELEEDAPEAVPPPSQDQEPPAAPSEEFREILGDIDVPDGVDPAFLAALPEEMRAEVIRDYQRQQRAERASRPVAPAPAQPAASAAAAPADGADAPPQEEAPAAPLVEPIDPVFLNALPPELQEEVLAEHERRLREAEEQQRRRQNATAAPVVEMDGAAVIASLPLNERAQVLAEMDETELAGLPSEMQNEARRARATHIEPNLAARYQRFLFRGAPVSAGLSMRGGGGGRGGAARPVANAGPVVGAQAGNAYQAPSDHAHLLDRESILTLCMLYLVDNNRVPHTRLQKVLRSACVNQATCDFIIWCLLALLDKASDANSDDEEINSIVPAYLDSIAVSGVGHNERALRIAENAQKVSIHSMLAVPMCKNILDLLASIARAYPGNFLPALLRRGAKPADVGKQSPTFHQFWTMVQNSSKAPKTKECTATPEQQLESCPLGQMLDSLQKPTMAKSPLKEKVLKVASQIMVTLPMDTLSLLKAKRDDDDDGEDKKPLSQKLEYVIRVMTTGSCATEGLNDGLTILSEAMRTFDDSTSITIYDHLFSAVTKLGEQLLPQIDHLIVELDEAQSQSQSQVQKLEEGLPSEQPSTSKTAQLVVDISGRTATGRFDGERLVIDGDQNTRLQMSSCKELQLPAVTVLTDKGGAQYALLSALQTLVKVRTYMKAIRKDKAKREAKKSKEPSVDTPAPTEDVANEGTVPPAPAEAVAAAAAAEEEEAEEQEVEEPRISDRLASLESLWCSLSECLLRLGKASDPHAVLALQPAAEAFFLVHASQQQQQQQHKSKKEAATEVTKRTDGGQSTSTAVPAAVATSFSHEGLREDFDPDTTKLIEFAEKHRQVLNQALRQNNAVLSAGGPFAILTQFPKLLDFDVKRKFFRKELTKLEPSMPRYRRNDVSVQVSRNRVFSDSFRELFRLRPSEWKNRFYIIFQGEEGQDAGGLLREWFSVITREIFNPNYALFITAPGDMVTYMINKASYINPEHLDYFKFVGRLIAKSVFEHKYLDCYFTRAFYKHILNLPVRYQDLESEDPAFFKSLDFLLQNPIDDLALDLTFSTEVEEFGVRSVRDLKPNGRKIEVTDANKDEYVKLVCQMKMTGSIRQQLDAFLTGFYEIIPKDLISMFNEQELELLISGLPTVDIDDMAANTDYKGYQKTSTHIQWFWRALRSFEKEDKAKFLQFVTGTSKVPLQGFASLEGMNGVQKFSIHCDSRGGDRLPAAHTCFNQLDLPQYESYDKLRHSLLLAIRECSEGFGFA